MDRIVYKNSMDAAGSKLIEMGMSLIREGQILLAKTKYVTIGVVTRWCNDEMIAPFFLDHYSFADEIVVLLSSDTTDNSRKIIAKYPNTRVKEFEYSSGSFNGKEANEIINKTVNEMHTDWVIGVDADEFVFPKGDIENKKIREVLSNIDDNLVYVDFWQIYRHKKELDLDPTLKAVWLRRHGDPDRNNFHNNNNKKPLIVRSGLGINWGIGLHNYLPNDKIRESRIRFDGAHWRMADPKLAVSRRLRGRRENVSRLDIENQWSFDNFDITEEEILQECRKHLNDPQLF